jgi:ferredoxin
MKLLTLVLGVLLLSITKSFVSLPVNKLVGMGHRIALSNSRFSPRSNDLQPLDADDSNGFTYSIVLPKSSGISLGSDLSFRWVFVLDVDPNSAAANSVKKGDYVIGFGNTSLIAQDFDFVIKTLSKQPASFNYTFFRGKKDQLMGGSPVLDPSEMTVTVRIQEDGKKDRILTCSGGTNLRRLLVANGINVYRSITRWTNCNGKQRCGTCIIDVTEGHENCSRRALDEEATLRENPESYRLSCVTSVYGDVTVKVQGPVNAAQWTR